MEQNEISCNNLVLSEGSVKNAEGKYASFSHWNH